MMSLAKALLVPILLLPGGFLVAALLWLLQRRRHAAATPALRGPDHAQTQRHPAHWWRRC